ncbi:hypothetical protein PHYC_01252 [Phycisphaerales bacterium]|nr:hypothetical protein PHYC_01252 [Phycisphaerales bacterium]
MAQSRSEVRVQLSPPLRKYLARLVRSGRYGSTADVIENSLILLAVEEAETARSNDRIREMISEGARQAARGEFVSAEEVRADLRRRRAEYRRSQRKRA